MAEADTQSTRLAVLHFAVTMLWVETFKSRENPLEEAKAYAEHIRNTFPTMPSVEAVQSEVKWQVDLKHQMTEFFDHVVSQTQSETGSLDS